MNRTSNPGAPVRERWSRQDILLAAGSFAASTAAWILVCAVRERREAWDTGAWFTIVLPLMIAGSGVAGGLRPSRAWRWPLAIAGGQGFGLLITGGGSLSLWPMTLIAIGFLFVPCFVAARVGARLGRR